MAMQETRFPGNPDLLREIFKAEIPPALAQNVDATAAEVDAAAVDSLNAKMDAAAAENAKRGGQVVRRVFIGRNDPCPCGSGRKFKKCCIDKAR